MPEQEIIKRLDKIESLLTDKLNAEKKALDELKREAFNWNKIKIKAYLEKDRALTEEAERLKQEICNKYAISVADLVSIVEGKEAPHDAERQGILKNDN